MLRPEIVFASGKTSFDFFECFDEEEAVLGVGGERKHQGIKIETVLGNPFLCHLLNDLLRDPDPPLNVGWNSFPVGGQDNEVTAKLFYPGEEFLPTVRNLR